MKNEGGLQEELDILPLLEEESYLKAYPEERKCQAFLELCGAGDIEAIVDLLAEDDEEACQENAKHIDVLRYQDQIKTMNSGLHVAVQNQQTQVAWLLLLLASNLPMQEFPAEVVAAAEALNMTREDQTGKTDIRGLKDAGGATAEQRAASLGGVWRGWVHSGRLKAV